ncbi:ABC transporter permease subunit, partial [Mesorhizobium sp.]
MGYSLDFGWLAGAAGVIARGAAMTLLLIVVTTLAGTFLSILGAAGRRNGPRPLKLAIGWYVEVMRNTPFLVQLFFIFFGLPSLGIRLDPILAAML